MRLEFILSMNKKKEATKHTEEMDSSNKLNSNTSCGNKIQYLKAVLREQVKKASSAARKEAELPSSSSGMAPAPFH